MRLDEFSSDIVHIACRKCERAGRYRRRSLIERHGAIALPDLLRLIATGCPRNIDQGNDRCGAFYPQLVRST
ncbi:MAG: hypothetical protein ACK5W0_00220 [Labrys sp. (in: a-proteobacteria)]